MDRIQGSSPLARGLPDADIALVIGDGIIPARAGFTWSRHHAGDRPWDHPRSRGVYGSVPSLSLCDDGSSPLARGLPARMPHLKNSPVDHPRSRGVYRTCAPRSALRRGSSPLARGLLPGEPAGGLLGRIIPARAGFTLVAVVSAAASRDHPRSRGVYADGMITQTRTLWIIPARAGFTDGSEVGARDAADHPRSRGVYRFVFWFCVCVLGSSPLARGLRSWSAGPATPARIIPARAGVTRDVRHRPAA